MRESCSSSAFPKIHVLMIFSDPLSRIKGLWRFCFFLRNPSEITNWTRFLLLSIPRIYFSLIKFIPYNWGSLTKFFYFMRISFVSNINKPSPSSERMMKGTSPLSCTYLVSQDTIWLILYLSCIICGLSTMIYENYSPILYLYMYSLSLHPTKMAELRMG